MKIGDHISTRIFQVLFQLTGNASCYNVMKQWHEDPWSLTAISGATAATTARK